MHWASRFFGFRGLLSRREAVLTLIAAFVLYLSICFVFGMLFAVVNPDRVADIDEPGSAAMTFIVFVSFAYLLSAFSVLVRRLRDTGTLAWLALLVFVPVVQVFLVLYALFAPGWQQSNGCRHMLKALKSMADVDSPANAAEMESIAEIIAAMRVPPHMVSAAIHQLSMDAGGAVENLLRNIRLYKREVEAASPGQLHADVIGFFMHVGLSDGPLNDLEKFAIDQTVEVLGVSVPLPPYVRPLLGLAARLAKADGRVSEEELAVLEEFFSEALQLSAKGRASAVSVFREVRDSRVEFDSFLLEFSEMCGGDQHLVGSAFLLLRRIAESDGEVTESERILLSRASSVLGVPHEDGSHEWRDSSNYRPSEERNFEQRCRQILGVGVNATEEEIRMAYRELSMKNHPDKVARMSAAIRAVAEEEMKKINEAYSYLQGATQ